MEEYQIRGIYLYQSLKRREVDDNYERHSFRRKYKKNMVKGKGKGKEVNDGNSTAKAIGDQKELYGDAHNLREDLVVEGICLEELSDG